MDTHIQQRWQRCVYGKAELCPHAFGTSTGAGRELLPGVLRPSTYIHTPCHSDSAQASTKFSPSTYRTIERWSVFVHACPRMLDRNCCPYSVGPYVPGHIWTYLTNGRTYKLSRVFPPALWFGPARSPGSCPFRSSCPQCLPSPPVTDGLALLRTTTASLSPKHIDKQNLILSGHDGAYPDCFTPRLLLDGFGFINSPLTRAPLLFSSDDAKLSPQPLEHADRRGALKAGSNVPVKARAAGTTNKGD